jgi:hypothetical protein
LSLERSTNGEMIAKQSHQENPLLERPTGERMLIGWVWYFGISEIIWATLGSSLGSALKKLVKWAV